MYNYGKTAEHKIRKILRLPCCIQNPSGLKKSDPLGFVFLTDADLVFS